MWKTSFRFNTSIAVSLLVALILSIPVEAQKNDDGSSPQYLFSEFSTGIVMMKNGLTQNARLNFNTVSEKVVYEKENEVYDLLNITMIESVIINNQVFVPVGKKFNELLLVAHIPLMVQYKGEILPPEKTVGYGGKSLVSSVETLTSVKLSMGYYNLKLPIDYSVKVEKVYVIKSGENSYSFANERQFVRLFPQKESELKGFIKQNHIKFENTSDIIKLVIFCNELFPPSILMS
jgi:hypothetical protein